MTEGPTVPATDYERIKAARSDFSDELVHMTRGGMYSLLRIIRDGYLKAGFALRGNWPTILGPYPAVCFSEMPLMEVRRLHDAALETQRYSAHGVCLPKDRLFREGALPVIYGDEALRGTLEASGVVGKTRTYSGGLSPDHQYRWVNLKLSSYALVDWTHEREWRARPVPPDDYEFEGVPLQLSPWGKEDVKPTFRFFVPSPADETAVRAEITRLTGDPLPDVNTYSGCYLHALRSAEVVVI